MTKPEKPYNKYIISFFLVAALAGPGISYGQVYLYHLALPLLLLVPPLLLARRGIVDTLFNNSTLIFPFIVFWYSLSYWWSLERSLTLQYTILTLLMAITVMLLSQKISSKETFRRSISVIGLFLAFEIFLSIIEIVTPLRWPISPFSNVSGAFGHPDSLLKFTAFELEAIKLTPTALHWNPNNLAIFLTICLPFVLYHLRKAKRVFLTAGILLVILMTGSRLCIVSVFIILLWYFWLENKKHFLLTLGTGIVCILFLNQYQSELNRTPVGRKLTEVNGIYTSTLNMLGISVKTDPNAPEVDVSESGLARKFLLSNGWHGFIASKGLGVGGGASHILHKNHPDFKEGMATSMHNFWFEILVEGGIILFIAFMLWYISVLKSLYKRTRALPTGYESNTARSLFMSMVIFVPAAISASSVIYFIPMWILFALCIAFIKLNPLTNETSAITG